MALVGGKSATGAASAPHCNRAGVGAKCRCSRRSASSTSVCTSSAAVSMCATVPPVTRASAERLGLAGAAPGASVIQCTRAALGRLGAAPLHIPDASSTTCDMVSAGWSRIRTDSCAGYAWRGASMPRPRARCSSRRTARRARQEQPGRRGCEMHCISEEWLVFECSNPCTGVGSGAAAAANGSTCTAQPARLSASTAPKCRAASRHAPRPTRWRCQSMCPAAHAACQQYWLWALTIAETNRRINAIVIT